MVGDLRHGATREARILYTAIDAFAAHGVRGASLRDIARDAGVSLALISHHFGDKTSLVAAAAEQTRLTCAPALTRLCAKLDGASGHGVTRLAEVWVEYLEEAFGSEETLPQLRLLHRLHNDPAVEPAVCASLDIAEAWLRRALKTAFPQAPDASIAFAMKASHSALITMFIDGATGREGDARAGSTRRELLINYVSAAITATLSEGTQHFGLEASLRDSAAAQSFGNGRCRTDGTRRGNATVGARRSAMSPTTSGAPVSANQQRDQDSNASSSSQSAESGQSSQRGVTKDELIAAAESAGPVAKDVEAYSSRPPSS